MNVTKLLCFQISQQFRIFVSDLNKFYDEIQVDEIMCLKHVEYGFAHGVDVILEILSANYGIQQGDEFGLRSGGLERRNLLANIVLELCVHIGELDAKLVSDAESVFEVHWVADAA